MSDAKVIFRRQRISHTDPIMYVCSCCFCSNRTADLKLILHDLHWPLKGFAYLILHASHLSISFLAWLHQDDADLYDPYLFGRFATSSSCASFPSSSIFERLASAMAGLLRFWTESMQPTNPKASSNLPHVVLSPLQSSGFQSEMTKVVRSVRFTKFSSASSHVDLFGVAVSCAARVRRPSRTTRPLPGPPGWAWTSASSCGSTRRRPASSRRSWTHSIRNTGPFRTSAKPPNKWSQESR